MRKNGQVTKCLKQKKLFYVRKSLIDYQPGLKMKLKCVVEMILKKI